MANHPPPNLPTLPHMPIGVLARESGCKVETIRYYERIGLMPKPARTGGGHRMYSDPQMRRLSFIRRGRELGFTIDAVRVLLGLVDGEGRTCGEVEAISRGHLDDVRTKIADLRTMETVLAGMVAECKGGAVPECPVVEALFEGH